jgi:tetratricopeptide (TPR) repeat protein
MNAVTYSDEVVINFLNNEVIPIQVQFDFKPLTTKYNLQWTPTIIVLDSDGKEYNRTVGYISPDEFVPFILLGIGKGYMELENYNKAIDTFKRLIDNYPKSKATPEAIYYHGVCGYKSSHEPKHLKNAYELLKNNFPDSDWTLRAEPYKEL